MKFSSIVLAAMSLGAMVFLPAVIFAQNSFPFGQETLAAVNGSPITRHDLEKEKQLLNAALALDSRGNLIGQGGVSDSELLDLLIDRALIVQQALAKGIEIPSRQANEALEALKNRLGGSTEFGRYLLSVGMTEEQAVEHFRTGLMIKRYLQNEVIQSVRVNDSEMNSFYLKYPDEFMRPNQVRALHLFVAVGDEEQRGEALRKIQGIQLKLTQGADFGAMALENSDCPSRTKGGDLGYFTFNQIIAPVADIAFTLQPGQTSDVVASPLGYHLIKVIDRKPPSRIAFKDVRDKIERTIRRNKENQALARYMARLRKEAEIVRYSITP